MGEETVDQQELGDQLEFRLQKASFRLYVGSKKGKARRFDDNWGTGFFVEIEGHVEVDVALTAYHCIDPTRERYEARYQGHWINLVWHPELSSRRADIAVLFLEQDAAALAIGIRGLPVKYLDPKLLRPSRDRFWAGHEAARTVFAVGFPVRDFDHHRRLEGTIDRSLPIEVAWEVQEDRKLGKAQTPRLLLNLGNNEDLPGLSGAAVYGIDFEAVIAVQGGAFRGKVRASEIGALVTDNPATAKYFSRIPVPEGLSPREGTGQSQYATYLRLLADRRRASSPLPQQRDLAVEMAGRLLKQDAPYRVILSLESSHEQRAESETQPAGFQGSGLWEYLLTLALGGMGPSSPVPVCVPANGLYRNLFFPRPVGVSVLNALSGPWWSASDFPLASVLENDLLSGDAVLLLQGIAASTESSAAARSTFSRNVERSTHELLTRLHDHAKRMVVVTTWTRYPTDSLTQFGFVKESVHVPAQSSVILDN